MPEMTSFANMKSIILKIVEIQSKSMQGSKQDFKIILEVLQKFENHYSREKSYTCAQRDMQRMLIVALRVTAQAVKI